MSVRRVVSLVVIGVAVLLSWPTPARAACSGSSPTWTAAGLTETDFSDCNTAASDGDTVNFPAGSATWTTAVTITKRLNLVGAGCTVDGNDRPTSCLSQITLDDLPDPAISMDLGTTNSSVSYFAFSTTTLTGSVAAFIGAHGNSGAGRIHHILFTNDVPGTTSNRRCVYMSGTTGVMPIYLIDHNTFYRCRVSMYAITGGASPWGSWSRNPAYQPHGLGEFNQPIIENNTIDHTGHIQGNCIELDRGASATFRFNDVVECPVESHTVSDGTSAGGYQFEVYGNTWTSCYGSGGNVSLLIRSGGGVYFKNTFPSAALDCQTPIYFDNSARNSTGNCSGANAIDWNLGSGTTYPAACWPAFDQSGFGGYFAPWTTPNPGMYKTPIPIFLNRKGASISVGVATTALNAERVITDCHEMQNETASFDGSCGTGVGTRAQMDAITSCTPNEEVDPMDAGTIPGTARTYFWVTDEGSWNTLLPANTSGRLYACNAAGNGWDLFYTPYTYPATADPTPAPIYRLRVRPPDLFAALFRLLVEML